jgi:hypothetical protein
MPTSHKLFGEIFFLDIIFDFTKNDFKSKKYAVYKAIYIKKCRFFKSLDNVNKSYLKLILKKLLKKKNSNKKK